MKKTGLIFIIVCMALCLLPFAGMAVRPTTESTENRRMAEFPSLMTEEGRPNIAFFGEFEDYFNDHFAFRNELVYADARIQADVFRVSSEEQIITGTDGWLFYTTSLPDYLGTDPLSAREAYGIAHNLALAENYVREQGGDFVLAVPLNKNTLYKGNMPYYDSYIVDETHNIDRLLPVLDACGVNYADLGEAFRSTGEVLYLKRDSHWNNKGALLAYNTIMDAAGRRHDTYADAPVTRTMDRDGDQNRMLFNFYGEQELNYHYEIPQTYRYIGESTSVEDVWIETESDKDQGSLLMFRDSYANTLIPFLSEQYRSCVYTKEGAYRLEQLVGEYRPNTVIFEKSERNLRDFLKTPPLLTAQRSELPENTEEQETGTTAEIRNYEFDSAYYEITGEVAEGLLGDATDIVVSVGEEDYTPYYTGENSYVLYLEKSSLRDFPVRVRVTTVDGERAVRVCEKTISEGEIAP